MPLADLSIARGHIGFFTCHSFLDKAAATGWAPVKARSLAAWELAGARGPTGQVQRIFTKRNRVTASFLISGYELNGLFRAE